MVVSSLDRIEEVNYGIEHKVKNMGLMQKIQDLNDIENEEAIRKEVEKNLQRVKVITAEAIYRCLKSKKMQQALQDLHGSMRKL